VSPESSDTARPALRCTAKDGILLLPGLLCDDRLFAPQVPHLKRLISADSIHTVHLLPAERSITAIARRVVEEVDERLGPDRPLVLVGLSMGGITAMEILRQFPDRVSGLSLLDTNAMAEGESASEERYAMVADAVEHGIGWSMRERLLPALLHPAFQGGTELPQLMVSMAEEAGLFHYRPHADALANRPDYSETLSRYDGPAQIIAGDRDVLCPPERQHHLLNCLPGAILHFIGTCGHISTLEQPETVNRLLTSWLTDIVGAANG